MSLLDGLNTEDKSSLVNAINEVLGKQLISEAITEKGVYTSNSDLWQTMANNIRLIQTQTEDTTLRDSLASILKDEGVNVTKKDDMASLINKTDKEFQDNTTILYNKMKDANYNVDSTMNMDALLSELTFKTNIRGSLTGQGVTNKNIITFTAKNLEFTPSLVYVTAGGVNEQIDVNESKYYATLIVTNEDDFTGASQYNTIEVNIIDKGFEVKFISGSTGGSYSSLGWTSIYGVSYTAIR